MHNLSADRGACLRYPLSVPAGATNLRIATAGGSGDKYLYLKADSLPGTSLYDCRSYMSGHEEACSFAKPYVGHTTPCSTAIGLFRDNA